MDIKKWFLKNARVGRGAVARLVEIERDEVDAAADDLGFGSRFTLAQLTELLEYLEEDEEEDEEDDSNEEEGDETQADEE